MLICNPNKTYSSLTFAFNHFAASESTIVLSDFFLLICQAAIMCGSKKIFLFFQSQRLSEERFKWPNVKD